MPLPTPHWPQLRGPPFSPLAIKHLPASGTPHGLFPQPRGPPVPRVLSLSLRSPAELEHPQGSLPVIPKSRSLSYQFDLHSTLILAIPYPVAASCSGNSQEAHRSCWNLSPLSPGPKHSAWSRPPHSVSIGSTDSRHTISLWRRCQLTARSCCRPPREAVGKGEQQPAGFPRRTREGASAGTHP